MWYVKIKDVSPQEIRRQIEEALAAQGMSLDDLLRKLGYFKLKEGRERFEKLYAGEEDVQLLRRVSARLGIDHEELAGERVSTDLVEYLRFTFVPFLLRVPERTRPGQIFPVAMAGLKPFLQVGRFPKLLEASDADRHAYVSKKIQEDYAKRQNTIFGPIIGYAFYYEFCQARAYSIDGELLVDYEIEPVTINAVLSVSRSALAAHGGVIPRLKNRDTGEISTVCRPPW